MLKFAVFYDRPKNSIHWKSHLSNERHESKNICSTAGTYIFTVYKTHVHTFMHVKVSPKEPRKTIFAKLGGTWLSRDSYGVYVVVTGSTWLLRGLYPDLYRENRLAWLLYGTASCEGVAVALRIPCKRFIFVHVQAETNILAWIHRLACYLCQVSNLMSHACIFFLRCSQRDLAGAAILPCTRMRCFE